MLKPLLAAASLALLLPPLGAAPLCKWVDERGRTQVAGVVPPRFQALATCTDSQRYELSPEAQHAAEALRAKRAAASATPRANDPTLPPAPPKPKPMPVPVPVVTPGTDCPTRWRLFNESAECFAPYRTVRGGLKQEAFKYCKPVPSPEPECGPREQ